MDELNSIENESYKLFREAVENIKIIRKKYIISNNLSFGKDSCVVLLASLQAHNELIQEKETKTVRDSQTICVFEGTWQGDAIAESSLEIGSEQFIDGLYSSSCLDAENGDICWQRIVRQAENDLTAELSGQGMDQTPIALRYIDFEGRQRDQYQQKRLTMTADGRFFFEVIAFEDKVTDTYIDIRRKNSSQPVVETRSEQAPKTTTKAKPSEPDLLDISLFYVWDGNDRALHNDLAISSDRWGIGIWANNRLGFAAFKGTDRVGIASDNQTVKNASGHYETTGIGMGFRLWKNRGITLENMLYYVDAQPYRTLVNPDCDSCDAQVFTADNYLQATVNLKTNSHGVNVGWMFTWKVLENQPNLDSLSSGLYLELQF